MLGGKNNNNILGGVFFIAGVNLMGFIQAAVVNFGWVLFKFSLFFLMRMPLWTEQSKENNISVRGYPNGKTNVLVFPAW